MAVPPEETDTDESGQNELIVVPNLSGQNPRQAQATLEMLGLGTSVYEERTPDIRVPRVSSTLPEAGSEIERGEVVTLVVLVPSQGREEDEANELATANEESRPEPQGQTLGSKVKDNYDKIQNAKRLAENAEKLANLTGGAGTAAGGAGAAGSAAAGATGAAGATVGAGAEAATAAAGTTVLVPVGIGIAIILVILAFLGLLLLGLLTVCNQPGKLAGFARWLTGASDYCGALTIGNGGRSGGGGAGAEFNTDRDIVLTSAYRANSFVDGDPSKPSAHGRGEAFDVALRNPTVPIRPNPVDSRIANLVNMARGLGFAPPVGDVVDEYNNPSTGTTGGHVHVEFNNGQCSGSPAANPPTDLVAIPANIPMSGVTDARVRSCMLPYITKLFQAAGIIP